MKKKAIYFEISEEVYNQLLLLIPVLKVSSVPKVVKALLLESLKIHDAKNSAAK
jgi:hypothetical protein